MNDEKGPEPPALSESAASSPQPQSRWTALFRSELVRSSAIYTISSIISSAIPLLMLPVLTRYLTTSDYGIVAMVAVLVGIASPFIGLNLHGAVTVRYFESGNIDIGRYLGNCFLLLLVCTLTMSGLLWLLSDPVSHSTAVPAGWLWTVIVLSAGQFVVQILLSLWQMQGRALHFGAFQILQATLNIGLTLLFVIWLRMNWQGRIGAQVLAVTLFSVFSILVLRRNGWLRFKYDRDDILHALRFGVPLIPHALGGMLMTQTDRIFITKMVGVSSTGLYAVGFQVALILELFAISFNRAFVPWLYKRLSENDAVIKRKIVKFTYLYFLVILLVAAALSVVMPPLLAMIVGKDFVGSSEFVPWIVFGFAFNGMYYMVGNYIFYAKANHLLAGATLVTAVANIGFNYVLISRNGAVGAAQASALAYFMMFALTWILSARVFPMPWKLRK